MLLVLGFLVSFLYSKQSFLQILIYQNALPSKYNIVNKVFLFSILKLSLLYSIQICVLLRYSLSSSAFLENLGSTTTLIALVNVIFLLRSIIMSLLASLIALITSLFKGFGISTMILLSSSSLAILTKISIFSTQSITASLTYLVILISYQVIVNVPSIYRIVLRVHEQGLGVAVELPLIRRYKAKERRRLLRSVRNYKLHTVGLPYAR